MESFFFFEFELKLGLLGERYGWSQARESIRDRLLEQSFENASQEFPWITDYKDRSVTELEMLYGGLFYPDLSKLGTFFYLRDPSYKPSGYTSQLNETEKQKLSDLKQRVKISGLAVRDNYRTPRDLATLVLNDLKSLIERDFPLSEVLSPLDKENKGQRQFVEEQGKMYVSRKTYWKVLDAHINGNDNVPLIITGLPSCGKSSLLCKFILKKAKPKPTDILFYHFVGLFHNDAHKTILRLITTLKTVLKLSKTIAEEKEELLHSLTEWISLASKEASSSGKKIVSTTFSICSNFLISF